ncbi:MGDG synthase family glycosyltransferase [Clostridium sp. HV4-5-A1G]|uniref:MGDG synthase family glycosyltransferase n=1 Tax=Clostridium sp. HV4-5-A1G TaxID=2004595 RepID=UPI0012385FC3|nr:glycosyltransferase [Clostridium sp. HV4-5-A1G]KAA8675924.1 UDP-N-acetylglucosamine--LPS N-acetylglucosamine transferase [Clostridium sp. HV4-5-A1G]
MNVLILSISAGGGHGNAAEALKSYISLRDPASKVKIVDALKYINPIIDKVVIGSYLKSLKVSPSLYGKLYSYSEGDYTITTTISSKLIESLTYKLLPLINEFDPDILISTHSFTTEMLSVLKSKYHIGIPCMCIITDYYSHTSWLHPYIDAYVISNKDMIKKMMSKGIPKDTIYNLGIPVKPEFNINYNRCDTLKNLKLSQSKFTILVMGGSLGLGKIADIYKELDKINEDIQIIIITGKNKKLYSELLKIKMSSSKETRIIGFTDQVNKYMQASDLLLTKPGGLTISEALICKIPLGLFSPIPGQEEKNAQFLLRNNLAVNLTDISKCKENIEKLLNSKEKLKIISENCNKFARPYAVNDIFNLINWLIEKNLAKKTLTGNEKINNRDTLKTFFKCAEEHFVKTAQKLFAGN